MKTTYLSAEDRSDLTKGRPNFMGFMAVAQALFGLYAALQIAAELFLFKDTKI